MQSLAFVIGSRFGRLGSNKAKSGRRVEEPSRQTDMNRKLIFFLVGPGVYIAMATFSLASPDDGIPVGFKANRYSHLWERNPFTLVVSATSQATVSVHPEKAGGVQTVAEATVSVVHPEKSGTATSQLPGQLSAYTDAPIYAQTSGYLKSWAFDIGAKVKANDILGEIDTPEVDQALAQAKAQLQTDQSALQLAQVTYQRYQRLFVQLVLDAQTRDTAADTYREDQAKVAADEANIERLNALECIQKGSAQR